MSRACLLLLLAGCGSDTVSMRASPQCAVAGDTVRLHVPVDEGQACGSVADYQVSFSPKVASNVLRVAPSDWYPGHCEVWSKVPSGARSGQLRLTRRVGVDAVSDFVLSCPAPAGGVSLGRSEGSMVHLSLFTFRPPVSPDEESQIVAYAAAHRNLSHHAGVPVGECIPAVEQPSVGGVPLGIDRGALEIWERDARLGDALNDGSGSYFGDVVTTSVNQALELRFPDESLVVADLARIPPVLTLTSPTIVGDEVPVPTGASLTLSYSAPGATHITFLYTKDGQLTTLCGLEAPSGSFTVPASVFLPGPGGVGTIFASSLDDVVVDGKTWGTTGTVAEFFYITGR